MPIPDASLPLHNCLHVLDHQYSCRPDLTDTPLPNAQLTWFTDGSSFMENGARYAGYAIVSQHAVIESASLPVGTSAQAAELWGLIRALELATEKTINVYTDSKYAFLTIQAHAAIYKERGFTDSTGKPIQHAPLIKRLISAAQLPKSLAVIHCPGHQKADTLVAQGNRFADREAKLAAHLPLDRNDYYLYMAQEVESYIERSYPTYTQVEREKAEGDLKASLVRGWYTLPDNRLVVPVSLAWPLVSEAHQTSHSGKTALAQQLQATFYIPNLQSLVAKATSQCPTCAQVNAKQGPRLPPGQQPISYLPMDYLMVDFTDMPKCHGYKALLIFIDTYSGWIEAFPTRNKLAIQVARFLLKEIIPRFGCPSTISSDNGPEFVQRINRHLAEAAGLKWS
ncbi:protein NYNRIN-like [Pantherophis guttatus]|uniref:Protein NYNRIN-like n=1 Tax=Pantherophis guttatus TaxID=94885 RepID=A0ABM3Z160_PANGU|nr:protein NYNRIN-like [Pantherophis guttatus]